MARKYDDMAPSFLDLLGEAPAEPAAPAAAAPAAAPAKKAAPKAAPKAAKSTKAKIVVHKNDGDFVYPLDPKAFLVCGIDEAGRGPLMGDVVAACVILDPHNPIEGLNDSKKLTEKKRELLFPVIKEKALAYGIGRASPQEIDEINILNATYLAMARAYEAMNKACDLVLIDGNRIPPQFTMRAEAVVKGDARVMEIAAASILAKVTRDHDCLELDKVYPQYEFAKHKGYPTPHHLELLKTLPIIDCYRKSFGPITALLQGS